MILKMTVKFIQNQNNYFCEGGFMMNTFMSEKYILKQAEEI